MKSLTKSLLNLLMVWMILVLGSPWPQSSVAAKSTDTAHINFPVVFHEQPLEVLQVPFDTVQLAQYNPQFLFPEDTPEVLFDWKDHFPSSSLRAGLVGAAVACMDIVAFEEISNNSRRKDVFDAMEANAANCGRSPLIDGGTRYFDFFVGPHNAQTDPILDDELAIASRFPILEVHQTVFDECSFWECFADKGVIHVRVWRGPGFPASDAMDIFATHLEAEDDSKIPAQLDQLAAFIMEHHDLGIPVVIMGDFNINGEDVQSQNYLDMKAKLEAALGATLMDAGKDAGNTNNKLTSRIDYILVSGADVPGGVTLVDCFEEFNTDELRQSIAASAESPPLAHDGLSDHCAVLSELHWAWRQVVPIPGLELPRDLRVEVSRLQEITQDVPDTLEIPVPVLIATPFGNVDIPIRIVVGCDGLTDHFGSLSITAGALEANRSFDEDDTIEGDDITREPPWEATLAVPVGVTEATIEFSLQDDDDLACGFDGPFEDPNDRQDINPYSGSKGITMTVNFLNDEISTENGLIRLGSIGEAVALTGTDSDDRARVTLVIESLYSNTHDSDQDGLSDADEAYIRYTNPLDPDTDDDGLFDGEEVNVYGTNPLDPDTDDDGLTDGDEIHVYGTNPLDADTDDDGLIDGDEVNVHGTSPLDPDTDDDGLTDGEEVHVYGTNPLEPDTDDDELMDGDEVHTYGTDPLDPDTDDDGLFDGEEVNAYGTNPLDPDTDDDELTDGLEVELNTNPLNPDTDGDGIPDGEDVEWLQNAINALGKGAFKSTGPGHRTSMLKRLDAIERRVAKGNTNKAILDLEHLQRRVDGCGSVPDKDDWIVDCLVQVRIRSFIDLLIDNLSS
jgi:endonuclease/exonuclease/phosphatase family metal-dependent hydrolase